ncbi:MAG: hypothetical protein K5686_08090 [Lachnospiraceae bacterium]|nr:hypothetical protein [Lachnospiraceae bacterium]
MQIKYFENSVKRRGNLHALKEVMRRAASGERIKTAFIGGSITQGYSATDGTKCYAYLTAEWFRKNFPDAQIEYINAGIGATTSQYGVARAERDLLCHDPDVVFVEFSVNDADSAFFMETYEGLIRRILKAPRENGGSRAVILLHNIKYDDGSTAEAAHYRIGEHYDLPCISVKSSIYAAIKDGDLRFEDITADGLHPGDEGHRLLAEVICYSLKKALDDMENPEEPAAELPAPLTVNGFEDSSVIGNDYTRVTMRGFVRDTREKEYDTDCFRGGFTGHKARNEICFRFRGSSVAVQYRRTVKRPALIAEAVIDGDEDNAVILDGNFDQDWGDCLSLTTVMYHGSVVRKQTRERYSPAAYEGSAMALDKLKGRYEKPAEHELRIRILGTAESLGYETGAAASGNTAWMKSGENKDSGFDLVSVLVSGSDETGLRDVHELLFMKPRLMERIWGGSRLKTEWGYESEKDDKLGECWAVSCNDIVDSEVADGSYKGKTISELWKREPRLFGYPTTSDFPLLVKIIEAKENLSVQVHPHDDYAFRTEKSRGKRECWYILDCPENSELILGNRAKDKEELKRMIADGDWDGLISYVKIKKGDFLEIPPGTMHAITSGVMLLEVQQNSDITYRVYDYGRPRELHIDKAVDVLRTPNLVTEKDVVHDDGRENEIILLEKNTDYSVWTLKVNGSVSVPLKDNGFVMASVLEGEGDINGRWIKKGDHFIVPFGYGTCEFSGSMRINFAAT